MTTRALIAARKSTKVRKAATGDAKAGSREGHSLHTQDERARAFCERLSIEVVGAAADTISGRVAPIDRKELGAWLAEPHRFDVLVAYRSDRLSRGDQEDWTRIEHWATEHNKTLIVVDGSTGVRYPARDDSDYWQWTAMKRQAGREWDEIRERNLRSQAALVDSGAVTGRAPFGYRITGEKYAKRLEVFEPEAQMVREVFDLVTRGEGLRAVAEWLTLESGRAWDPTLIARMVRSWKYAGRMERNGRHYADCPPIVTPDQMADAQRAMKSRVKKAAGGRPSLAPALMIPVCGQCGLKMYRMGNRGSYAYYCMGRHGFGVNVEDADAFVVAVLISSTEPEMMPQTIPGRDHRGEVASLKRDRQQALDRDDIDAVVRLTGEIKDLEARDVVPDRVELRPTGRKVGQAFAAMDREALRTALRDWTVIAHPETGLKVLSPWETA